MERSKFITGTPVRRIRRSRVSVRGAIHVHGKYVGYESTLERDLLILLDFDPTVVEVVEQPVRIMFRRPGERRQWPYVPDFYVRYGGSNPREVLYQVKYDDQLRKAFREMKPAWREAMRVAREHGMTHRILTDSRIRGDGHHLCNATFLGPYLRLESDGDLEGRIAAELEAVGPCTPDALLKRLPGPDDHRAAALPHLWRMIALGRVATDLNRRLTMTSTITIVPGEG